MIQDTRKRNSTEAKLTEVSPIKQTPPGAPLMLEWKSDGVIEPAENKWAQRHLPFDAEESEKGYETRVGTPPPPPSAREQKRPKKQATTKKDKQTTGSAGSATGHRLDQ
jgi:hypothetical protein